MNVLETFSLSGKRALITGASKGIGFAIAEAYASAGADLILCARNSNDLNNAAQQLSKYKVSIEVHSCDVTNINSFNDLVVNSKDIHIFCNNAGTNIPKPIDEITEQNYDEVMNINLKAAFFAAKSVYMHMKERGIKGSIINMSSQMGHVGAANRTLYCASKWGLEGLTKALSIEAGKYLIRVNTICPTFIETPMTKPFLEDQKFLDSVLNKIKLGRVGQVSDIVGAAVYLASDASSLVTGSSHLVDGGWTIG